MSCANEEVFFGGGWKDDDARIDVYALFVLEDVPVADIEDALRRNEEQDHTLSLWLADDYNNLSDFRFANSEGFGTKRPIDPNWQSPFRGKTAADAADFLRNVPKPRRPLCKTYFAILDKTLYKEQGLILACKVMGDDQVQSIPCAAAMVGIFFSGHNRDTWEQEMISWEEEGLVLMA